MDDFCEKCNNYGIVKLDYKQVYLCSDCELEDYIGYVDYSTGDINLNREIRIDDNRNRVLLNDPYEE